MNPMGLSGPSPVAQNGAECYVRGRCFGGLRVRAGRPCRDATNGLDVDVDATERKSWPQHGSIYREVT